MPARDAPKIALSIRSGSAALPSCLESCYEPNMTRDQVKEVLDRVLTWPPERQEDATEILMSIEAQDNSSYRLSDEQLTELLRRRAEKKPKTLTRQEFDE